MTARQSTAFLSFDSFAAPEREAPVPSPFSRKLDARSPFMSVYAAEVDVTTHDPYREAFAALVDELHDDEFEQSLATLQSHGRALHDTQLAAGNGRAQADRLLTQYFEPLVRETAAMVDAMAQRFVPQEAGGIVEGELETFADSYTTTEPLAPEFEQFFGKLLRKVAGVAKAAVGKAWQGLKQLGLAPLLHAIKSHLLAFLKRAVQRVMGKLPAPLLPLAQKLAHKLGFPVPAAADASPAADAGTAPQLPAAAGDDTTSQQELDEQLASTLLAQDEGALQLEAAGAGSNEAATPVFAELDDARERFINELEALKDGESAEPAMQHFLPAILPALRMASKVIGHDRLAGFVAKALAPLIGRLIGPQQAPQLARAIAGAGLKLLGMETADEVDTERLAAPAVAATVEETMARVAALPAEVHADPELLQAFTLEAFEAAAAANLPAVLSDAAYAQRPELLEAGVNVSWPMLPLRGGPRRYKRCSQVFSVQLSPHMAMELESFEGAPLADFVQDQLGSADAGVLEAEVHVFEALPGSTLADIARHEREALGEGFSDEANVEQLHPLTPQAAATLLGKPGLGRAWWPQSRHRPLAGGQRFYALRLAGPLRHRHRHRPLHLRLTLDAVQDQVRACVFISEVKAQALAVQLRQQAAPGTLATGFQAWLRRRLSHVLFGLARHRLRIVNAAQAPGVPSADKAQALPPLAARAFAGKLQTWLVQGFAEGVKAQSQAIIAATENAADGITLQFTLAQPPGLKALLAGSTAAVPDGSPSVTMAVTPGHHCV